jgi:phosphoadenosine phosphosulfate reductase
MALFKHDSFVMDAWQRLADGAPVPHDGKCILTVPQWEAHRDQLGATPLPLGLLLGPANDPRALAGKIARFSLVAIAFPKFSDGRGFSLARRVRDELGFTGELRAVGEVLYDQLQLLARCGFDAFEITNTATLALLESGRRPGLGLFYQPAAAGESADPTRPWARRASPRTQ